MEVTGTREAPRKCVFSTGDHTFCFKTLDIFLAKFLLSQSQPDDFYAFWCLGTAVCCGRLMPSGSLEEEEGKEERRQGAVPFDLNPCDLVLSERKELD